VHRNPDLAVADLSELARVLALDPGERLPCSGKPVSSSTEAKTSICGVTRSATARTTSAGSQGLSVRNCCIDW
jgi:hypothetical protein